MDRVSDTEATMQEIESAPVESEPRWKAAGEPYQWTRDELVDYLRHLKHHVTARQLRSWQAYGILPKPIRTLPPGSTDGRARTLYPRYMLLTIIDLLERAREGATRDELKAEAPELIRKYRRNDAGELPEDGFDTPGWPRIPRALQRAVWDYLASIGDDSYFDRALLTLETKVSGNIEIPIKRPPPLDD